MSGATDLVGALNQQPVSVVMTRTTASKLPRSQSLQSVRREHYGVRRERHNKAIAAMESHNADVTQTYQQGINQFSDLTLEQFQALPIRGYMASAKAGLPKVWYTSLSSSWLIALSRTVAATMVSWTTRSHSTGPRPFPLSPRTHTLPVMAPIFPR